MSIISPAIIGSPVADVRQGVLATEALSPQPTLHVDFMAPDFARQSPIPHEELWSCVELFAGESEVHLQTRDLPIERALASRATTVTVPVELPTGLAARHDVLEAGRRFGLAISPSTQLDVLIPHLDSVDSVTVMTSEPGTSDYDPAMLDRIKRIRAHLVEVGRPHIRITADGGMTRTRVASVVAAGADTCVCASAIFTSPNGVGPAYSDLLSQVQLG